MTAGTLTTSALSLFGTLHALLNQREQQGAASYGRKEMVPLDGRDPAQDLVEELLDAAAYALKWRDERAALLGVLEDIVDYLPALPVPGETTWPVAVRRLEAARRVVARARGEVPE